MGSVNLKLREIFGGIDAESLKKPVSIQVPNDFYRQLLDYTMERGYLNEVSERADFVVPDMPGSSSVQWLRIARLPVHPDKQDTYDLIARWQGVLATLHTWGHRIFFLLQRVNGETGLYLGAASQSQAASSADAVEQMKEAATGSMPGISLEPVEAADAFQAIQGQLMQFKEMGAVTGIPSFKNDNKFGILQTLDQLAFGIRDMKGREKNYSLLVIADPIGDMEITETIHKMQKLSSEIHLDVSRSVNESESQGESKQVGLNVGAMAGSVVGMALSCIGHPLLGMAASTIGRGLGVGQEKNVSLNYSQSVTTQFLDKYAEYAEKLIDSHIQRLNKGRNLGFWNTGVYVFGNTKKDIVTVTGMLRSIYSGDQSYLEPIRVHNLKYPQNAMAIVRDQYSLIPLLDSEEFNQGHCRPDQEWHLFGRPYQYVSTPMNTEELSLATSLPRRDVPGLRFVKTAVRFANNPAPIQSEDKLILGKVVDTGVAQSNPYCIDVHALVRHALVTGSTGCGKSTTCKTLLNAVLERNIPVLVIEPAKDDYVRWALEMNKELPEDKQFRIYMPGVERFDGVRCRRLKLNPFQPAAIPNAPVDLMTRCEQFTELLNASLPVSDVLPVIIDETLFRILKDRFGDDILGGDMPPPADYPRLDKLNQTARKVLAARGYDPKVQNDIGAALETRFTYLTRGKRGDILNVNHSTNYTDLFSHPTIINVSRIANSKDKALVMSLLMLAIYEYRVSAYTYDEEYRKKAQQNKLLHLMVIEEAHNLLMRPSTGVEGTGNPQQIVADLFSNMISEIRGYGQGLLIVDQIPTRLIPDVVKNTNYKIVHRLIAPDDCETMAAGLALREDQKSIIPSLEVGNAIICGDLDDAAAWVKLNKPKGALKG